VRQSKRHGRKAVLSSLNMPLTGREYRRVASYRSLLAMTADKPSDW
jgi:hypothetical protein